MKKIINQIRQYFIALRKFGTDIVDLFKPRNSVEIFFKDPTTGKVLKTIKGRNIITSFTVSGTSNPVYLSGTDIMRRLLINPNAAGFGSESRQNANSASAGTYVEFMEFGVGNVPESSSDKGLATPIGYNNEDSSSNYKGIVRFDSHGTEPNARKTVTMQTGSTSVLNTTSTDVQFIGEWAAAELNGHELSEVALITSAGTGAKNFFARKTFTPFTKTSEFTLEIRWTIRF